MRHPNSSVRSLTEVCRCVFPSSQNQNVATSGGTRSRRTPAGNGFGSDRFRPRNQPIVRACVCATVSCGTVKLAVVVSINCTNFLQMPRIPLSFDQLYSQIPGRVHQAAHTYVVYGYRGLQMTSVTVDYIQ